MPIFAPSILSTDFSNMGAAIKKIEAAGASWVHLDVMDGVFVPNLTFGAKMVGDLRPHSKLIYDVHLMTVQPERLFEDFAKAGSDHITFHWEAATHHDRLIHQIHDLGCKAGISLVPSTPISAIEETLSLVDLVLVMTVNPGFGGQSLIPSCLEKVKKLRHIREASKAEFLITIDGGVNSQSLPLISQAKPDILVMGSAFFSAQDPRRELAAMAAGFGNGEQN